MTINVMRCFILFFSLLIVIRHIYIVLISVDVSERITKLPVNQYLCVLYVRMCVYECVCESLHVELRDDFLSMFTMQFGKSSDSSFPKKQKLSFFKEY